MMNEGIRSLSDKKKMKNKMIMSSFNNFIDITIETTPTLLNANTLGTESYTPVLQYPRTSSKNKRRKMVNLNMKIEKNFHSSTFSKFKGLKKRGITRKITRGRNFSALGKILKTNSSILIENPMEKGSLARN